MRDALDALRARGVSPYLVEHFPLSTWRALARRDLVDLYMDADRTHIVNLKLTAAGRELTDG
jgi:hypothetical protein